MIPEQTEMTLFIKLWFKSGNSIIEYQINVIDNYLYTSRLHDCLRERDPLARFILERLAYRVTVRDPHERAFLLGRQPIHNRIQFRKDNLSNYLHQWIRGEITSPPIKYWDVRGITNINVLNLTYSDASNVTDMAFIFYFYKHK